MVPFVLDDLDLILLQSDCIALGSFSCGINHPSGTILLLLLCYLTNFNIEEI